MYLNVVHCRILLKKIVDGVPTACELHRVRSFDDEVFCVSSMDSILNKILKDLRLTSPYLKSRPEKKIRLSWIDIENNEVPITNGKALLVAVERSMQGNAEICKLVATVYEPNENICQAEYQEREIKTVIV